MNMKKMIFIAFLSVCFLLVTVGTALAEGAGDLDTDPEGPELSLDVVNLLAPAQNFLSGRSWLMAAGIDTILFEGIPNTGLKIRGLKEVFIAPSPLGGALGAPVQQAGGPVGLVPFRDPAPAFSRNILVTRDFSQFPFQTEPHLAVDPDNPDHLVLGVIDFGFPAVSTYVSIDGGETWEGPFQVPFLTDDLGSGGDPVVGFDRKGNIHYASISIGVEEFSVGPLVGFALVSSISVSRSEDGGFTWPQTVSSSRSRLETQNLTTDELGRTRGTIIYSFFDKPWMAIGPHPENSRKDVIYVTYTDFTLAFEIGWVGELPFLGVPVMNTTIRLVKSEDSGNTWSDPLAISPTVRRTFGSGDQPAGYAVGVGTKRVVQGSQPVVAPDGTVYVAWLDTTDDDSQEGLGEIYVAYSDDGGESFSQPVRAAVFNEVGFRPRSSFFRFWGSAFPQIAIGPEGELYIVFAARPSDNLRDDADIFFISSLDRGESWSRPLRINGDEGAAVQFFPAIDVDPNGVVHVMWGDMRDDPAQTRYHIYYTRSEDQGDTWGFEIEELGLRVQDGRVTDFPSNPNRGFPRGLFIGDYFSIKATAEDVYMVWADTRLGEFGPINQKIGFSRQRAIVAPEVFMSPPAGPGGQQVTLQGFNFQPDSDVFIRVGGVIVSTVRTSQQGRFTTQVFIPIAGEGAHSVDVFDESGNFATTSFFMEFGFDTIQEMQRELAQQLQSINDLLLGIDSGSISLPDVSSQEGVSSNTGSGEAEASQRSGGGLFSCSNPKAAAAALGDGGQVSGMTWLLTGAVLSGGVSASSIGLLVLSRFKKRRHQ